MGLGDAATYAIEGLMAIFIFTIFFTSLLPSIISTINNNSTTVGLPQATILVVSLLLLFFILGVFMNMWKKITNPDQPQMGGY